MFPFRLDVRLSKKMEKIIKMLNFCDDNGKYIVGREVEKMSKSNTM
jgi:hypothetical protein